MDRATELPGHNTTDFLQGGGEMGARMREMDWAKTALGPAERWPQSLRTCVRIMLTSRQPMFVWWGEELINLYNDAYKSIVGGKHPEALGQPASVVWREIWDEVGPRAAYALRNNEGTYDESLLLIMERNGYPEETYYTFSYSPVPNDQGGAGGILCANTDDTQRIVGERQLSLLRELATATAEARTFDAACTSSAECLAGNPFDLPFALIYLADASQRRMELCGSCGMAPGHPAAPASVSLADENRWPFAEVLRTHRPVVLTVSPEADVVLPCGAWERPPKQVVAHPIASSGKTGRAGVLIAGLNPYRLFDDGYRGFLELVSAQIAASIGNARAYEEERTRAEELAELDRAKTTFFSNVSHEFRTPLTLMLGPLSDVLAEPATRLPEADRELLTLVQRNGQRLLKLVNTLLDFSRIEAGRVQAVYEPVDLPAYTAELASAFRAAVERAGMRLHIESIPLSEPAYIDRDMWEKIVLNLVSNAFKYTLEGEIRVSMREERGVAELSVQDTGTGIPEAELPNLFNRFHRVEGARGRTHEGTGIGLALVQELARLHGGTVSVESRPGAGSTFTVRVPLGTTHLPADRIGGTRPNVSTALGADPFVEEALRWLPDADQTRPLPPGAGVEPPSQRASAAATGRPRILLADDNADMRGYVHRLLSHQHEVVAVADGQEALRVAETLRPDLVLTDVMMPNLDGFGLLAALRSDARTAAIPVIMLSARAGEEARVEGLQAGADDYLFKPFSARELLARVDGTLALARLRREAMRREEELRAETASVLETINEGFVAFDAEFRFTHVNAAAERINGAPRQTMLGKELWTVFPALQGTVAEVEYRRAMRERVAVHFELQYEPWDRCFEVSAYPANDGGIAVYFRDITEQKSTLQALREADRRKDEFLATLAHELRNPLAPIRTGLHLMRQVADQPEAVARARAMMERQVQQMVRLIDDLLDLSRISRGKIELRPERLDLAETVRNAVETSRPLIEQGRHSLALELPHGPVFVRADGVRLAQVLSNLLNNAAKFTEPGGRIALYLEQERDTACVRITDTGVGIAPEMLSRVFEMFSQVDHSLERTRSGLGIGLSIVKQLVEMHGGTVEAYSGGPGQGSEFRVLLPVHSAVESPARETFEVQSARPVERKILVADDNVDAATSLAMLLELHGNVVRAVHDGEAAVAAAAEFGPDVVFLDIGMPRLNGYDACRQIRANSDGQEVVVVALTGWGQEEDRRRSREAGFDHHLVKPVELGELEKFMAALPTAQRPAV